MEEENKKKIEDVHKEIQDGGVELHGIDANEKQLYEEKRKERMKKIEDVKDLYDKAKNMMNELLTGKIELKSIDAQEKKKYDKNRQERLEKFKKLKETVDRTQILMEEIQDAPKLKKVDEQDLKQYKEEKEKAIEKLKSFSSILEEITSKDPIENLEKVDNIFIDVLCKCGGICLDVSHWEDQGVIQNNYGYDKLYRSMIVKNVTN